jgi:hypothetical protein
MVPITGSWSHGFIDGCIDYPACETVDWDRALEAPVDKAVDYRLNI